MSKLRRLGTDEFHYLTWVTPIGRQGSCPICTRNDCLLCLQHPNTSATHAELRWTGPQGGWVVRDLNSANGTWRNGIRLPAGVMVPLRPGDVLVFATIEAGQYTVEADPPLPLAVELMTGRVVPGVPGELYVEDQPPWRAVYRGVGWDVQQGESSKPTRDGTRIGDRWLIRLPTLNPTVGPHPLSYFRATLVLEDPTGDGKYALSVVQDGRRYEAGVLAPWRTLWALADRRIDDEKRGLGPSEVGWMSLEEVADMTGDSLGNVEVHMSRIPEYLKTKVKVDDGVEIQHAEAVLSRRANLFRLEIEARRLDVP